MHGDVQGVGVRFLAKQKANELRLKGYCKAFDENEIVMEVEGEEEQIEKFVSFIEKGVSPMASISSFSVTIFDELKGYTTMESDII
ncbi:acylphosphatase [Paenisporosarcina cavernae]|uniref:Acylphosphatase n=2 Tax=Paenisporosarcina cavernae TaxID=2320858 RepID=A0A385YVS3_9BACL|nr:acylphosphatase [Paenisporosarcina cavernae]